MKSYRQPSLYQFVVVIQLKIFEYFTDTSTHEKLPRRQLCTLHNASYCRM